MTIGSHDLDVCPYCRPLPSWWHVRGSLKEANKADSEPYVEVQVTSLEDGSYDENQNDLILYLDFYAQNITQKLESIGHGKYRSNSASPRKVGSYPWRIAWHTDNKRLSTTFEAPYADYTLTVYPGLVSGGHSFVETESRSGVLKIVGNQSLKAKEFVSYMIRLADIYDNWCIEDVSVEALSSGYITIDEVEIRFTNLYPIDLKGVLGTLIIKINKNEIKNSPFIIRVFGSEEDSCFPCHFAERHQPFLPIKIPVRFTFFFVNKIQISPTLPIFPMDQDYIDRYALSRKALIEATHAQLSRYQKGLLAAKDQLLINVAKDVSFISLTDDCKARRKELDEVQAICFDQLQPEIEEARTQLRRNYVNAELRVVEDVAFEGAALQEVEAQAAYIAERRKRLQERHDKLEGRLQGLLTVDNEYQPRYAKLMADLTRSLSKEQKTLRLKIDLHNNLTRRITAKKRKAKASQQANYLKEHIDFHGSVGKEGAEIILEKKEDNLENEEKSFINRQTWPDYDPESPSFWFASGRFRDAQKKRTTAMGGSLYHARYCYPPPTTSEDVTKKVLSSSPTIKNPPDTRVLDFLTIPPPPPPEEPPAPAPRPYKHLFR